MAEHVFPWLRYCVFQSGECEAVIRLSGLYLDILNRKG